MKTASFSFPSLLIFFDGSHRMKSLRKTPWLLITFSLLALSACSGGTSSKPTVDTAPIYTQIAATALAMQTQTALVMPVATTTPDISTLPNTTLTPLPGTPSVTPLALNTLIPPSQPSCDNMAWMFDVTYQDGYSAVPGEVMEKTWRIKNLGPCTWNTNYVLVFGWGGIGTNWNTVSPSHLGRDVPPDDSIEISMTLQAPKTKGEYSAAFRFQNGKGYNFGPSLTISILVE
jgi:hypothetical protein